ncbi:MAG TPA: universal stress protein [Vicinamibacterales bacterium]|nr:universal stress protein [Vicinamibacterales bacterium]
MWTYPPRRILVPVDFREASARALQLAGSLARTFDAPVLALHAETFEAPPYFTSDQVRTIERQRRAARTAAASYLQRHAERLAGVPVSPVISDAPPAEAILEAARSQDLIVMGTHGRRGPSRWWVGSVAERVVRDAQIPVLVVRAMPAPSAQPFSRVAVIAGRGTFDGPARRYAKGLASAFGGELNREDARTVKASSLAGATLVVMARPAVTSLLGLPQAASERALRACRRPVLFIPPV